MCSRTLILMEAQLFQHNLDVLEGCVSMVVSHSRSSKSAEIDYLGMCLNYFSGGSNLTDNFMIKVGVLHIVHLTTREPDNKVEVLIHTPDKVHCWIQSYSVHSHNYCLQRLLEIRTCVVNPESPM